MGRGRLVLLGTLLCFAVPVASVASGKTPGRVVYASDGAIFVGSADGAQRWRLTRSETDLAPSWSPDGTAVAFLRAEEHGNDLYVVPVNAQRETKLATDVGEAFDWAPDGGSIAYSSAGTDLLGQTSHLFSVDVRTGLVEQLTRGSRSDTEPVWSPDGRSLLFVGSSGGRLPGASSTDADIYRLVPGAGRAVQLTDDGSADYAPDWSPSGMRIAFASTRDSPENATEPAPEIYVMRADGRREKRLTFRPVAHDVAPSWSPDGRRIVFVEYEGGAQEATGRVRIIQADGSGDRAVTTSRELMAWDPSWGPDGRTVVFVASRVRSDGDPSDTDVAYRSLSSPKIRFLTDNDRFEWGPDWD